MANSIDTRLTELAERISAAEDRADIAETEVKKLKGTVTAHGVALKDKGK